MIELSSVKITDYKYIHYDIVLPTHYNKHDIIVNSYKYDISSHALYFILHKIRNNELKFIVDNKYTEKEFLSTIIHQITHDEAKKLYTKLSGLLVRENRQYYDELLRSSIFTMELLIDINRKMGLEFKVLKVFVDEFVTDKPLLIKNIANPFSYNFKESKFILFVKKLDVLGKQLYVTDNGLELNHNFSRDENLITDLSSLWVKGLSYSDINNFTSDLIYNRYDVIKLFQKDEKDIEYIYSDGVKIRSEFIDSNNIKYDVNYYYPIYQELMSNLVLAKTI